MKKELMNQINQIVLLVLFRSFHVLYQNDSRVHAEIDGWKPGLSLKLICGSGGPVLVLRKDEKNGIAKLPAAQRADITMRFKAVGGAFRVLTGQISVSEAYAEHQFSLEGDIFQAMSFVRCVEYAEAYLFPRFWAKRILKEIPEKELGSLRVYSAVLLDRKP